jgi:hypothetical protein
MVRAGWPSFWIDFLCSFLSSWKERRNKKKDLVNFIYKVFLLAGNPGGMFWPYLRPELPDPDVFATGLLSDEEEDRLTCALLLSLLLRLTFLGAEETELLEGAVLWVVADDLEAGLCDTAGEELRVVVACWVVAGLAASLLTAGVVER